MVIGSVNTDKIYILADAIKKHQASKDHERLTYQPHVFAAVYRDFLPEKYREVENSRRVFVDKHGDEWVRKVQYLKRLEDTGQWSSAKLEEDTINRLHWLPCLKGCRGYEGLEQMLAHGWMQEDSLTYCYVVEPPDAELERMLLPGNA